MAFVLGLTGNIACGKSTLGALLEQRYGADYVDADKVVHALYAAGTPETAAIARRFGAELLSADGTINRRKLGDIVMADQSALRDLERILDPAVHGTLEARLTGSAAPVVVLDAIRLIEGGLYKRCQAVWVVVCEPAVQIARLRASRNFTQEQATLRVQAQVGVEEKLRHATAVIHNDGSLANLEQQAADAWAATVQPYLVQSSPP